MPSSDGEEIAFQRQGLDVPILPPGKLPPRKYVPLERCSAYRLQIVGLPKGDYEVQCEGKLLSTVNADARSARGSTSNTS